MNNDPARPLFIDSNGLGRMTVATRIAGPNTPYAFYTECTLAFTNLAASINIGLGILETPEGRNCLTMLGNAVVADWHQKQLFRFGGDVNNMVHYVNTFLTAVRRDFPTVNIEDIGNSDTLAMTTRNTLWDGNLNNFQPKDTFTLTFNSRRVAAMGLTSLEMANERPKNTRFKHFLFLFALATAHELCHGFVAYLGQNREGRSDTPPAVTATGYSRVDRQGVFWGEAGRWLETALFGGTIEFYRDVSQDDKQAGMPYLVDANDVAAKIKSDFILALVEQQRRFQFPFPTTGPKLSSQERSQRGLQRLATLETNPPTYDTRPRMTARVEKTPVLFDIPQSELVRAATSAVSYNVQGVRVR